ncbi:MAG: D-alanine--D-alanine ligase [Candidatus Omnitrophota bacterium]
MNQRTGALTSPRTSNNFGTIGVLMGGLSSEREISLKSGSAVYEALKSLELEVLAIDITTDSVEENVKLLKSKRIDCAFLALHGRFGEDGQIQDILETMKIPYTGSGVRASQLAMDKAASRSIFESHGLRVPQYKLLDRASYHGELELDPRLNFPLVIKPVTQGSSIGLSIVREKDKLKKAIDLAFTFDDRILMEEYIKGREVTVGILNRQSLPVIEIIPRNLFFDYEAKYQPGMTDYAVPAPLEEGIAEKVSTAALWAHQLLGCRGFSRVDMILSDYNDVVVLEVNTIPGLTSTSLLPKAAKAVGIEFGTLCLELIKIAYEKE